MNPLNVLISRALMSVVAEKGSFAEIGKPRFLSAGGVLQTARKVFEDKIGK